MKVDENMKKIIISIIIIGMLLTTVPMGIVGQETVNEELSFVEEIFLLESEYFLNKYIVENGDIIQLNDDSETLPRFVPGELIVKFKESVKMEIPASTNGALGASFTPEESVKGGMGVVNTFGGILTTGVESIDQLNNENYIISIKELFPGTTISSMENIYKFTFPFDTDIIELMNGYNSDNNVVYAEPNYLFTTSYATSPPQKLIPNDPLFNQQWALNQPNDCDIDAPEAWNVKTGDSSVVIAIVDSGVDYNHHDLAANIWHDPVHGNPGYDFVDINTTLYNEAGFVLCPDEDYIIPDGDPMDVFGHGTHCAGIASAVTNNSVGVAGVSWNCKIMPVRCVFKIDVGSGVIYGLMEYDDSANAIIYAADHGADVISMSWGGMYYSQLIKDVLDYAYSNGVVLVAAAGNDNMVTKHYYPACYESVISVAAIDNADEKAYFSNYGGSVDVAAPGVDILSTVPGNQYVLSSGTSMAGPHVAGVAGLLISKNKECPYPAQMVKSMIPYITDDIDTDQYIGAGRINAYKALVQKPFAALLDSITSWEDVKGTIDIKGVAWGENFQYYVLEDGLGENPSSWTTLKTSITSQGGVLFTLDTTLKSEGLHTIRLKVVCTYGTYTDEIQIYVNNQAEGTYTANIFVSNCFNSTNSGPAWGVTKFATIQDGIDKAISGNTVFVYDGIYYEDIKIKGLLKTSISLIGQNKNWTIIDGRVNISSVRGVTVSGFTVHEPLILGISSECTISNNRISLSYWYTLNYLLNRGFILAFDVSSVYLFASSNNIVSGNILGCDDGAISMITRKSAGVYLLSSSHNMIYENTFTSTAIPIYLNWLSNKNIVKDNIINPFVYALCNGGSGCFLTSPGAIVIRLSINNVIEGNYIEHPYLFFGIQLDYASGNTITKNNIIHVYNRGIHFYDRSCYNKIIANEITTGSGLWPALAVLINDDPSMHNKIYYNNFYVNGAVELMGSSSRNCWYKDKLFGQDKGNCWGEYYIQYHENHGTVAKDEDNNGIWDDPFPIFCNSGYEQSQDKYPMVEPFDIENIDVSIEITEEVTSEESEYLVQFEEMINSQVLSDEFNINDIMNSHICIVPSTISQNQQNNQPSTQPSTQPNSEPMDKVISQIIIGSATLLFGKTASK